MAPVGDAETHWPQSSHANDPLLYPLNFIV